MKNSKVKNGEVKHPPGIKFELPEGAGLARSDNFNPVKMKPGGMEKNEHVGDVKNMGTVRHVFHPQGPNQHKAHRGCRRRPGQTSLQSPTDGSHHEQNS